MHIRRGYIPTSVRIKEKKEKIVSSEFIHVRLYAISPQNVIRVYLETNTKVDDADDVQKLLANKVQR